MSALNISISVLMCACRDMMCIPVQALQLATAGGDTPSRLALNCWKRAVSPQCAVKLNLTGQHEKGQVSGSMLERLIICEYRM